MEMEIIRAPARKAQCNQSDHGDEKATPRWQRQVKSYSTVLLLVLLILDDVSAFWSSSGQRCHHRPGPPQTQGLTANKLSVTPSIDPKIQESMKVHDPILLYVSKLLPAQKAADAAALYAWCRRLDEITDNDSADVKTIRQALEEWEKRFGQIRLSAAVAASHQDRRDLLVDPMDAALAECLQRNPEMDTAPFVDMMAGMKADTVDIRRIATLSELEVYGYQVAGTVGLMLLPLLIDSDASPDPIFAAAKEPAIALGTSIQLINILRDTAPDAIRLGRIYLPQELLKEEGVTDSEIMNLQASEGYCRVVKTVAERAETLLRQAEKGKSCLPGMGPLLVQIIVELYRGYLEELANLDYNNLSANGGERVRISTTRKLGATLTALGAILRGK